MLIVDTHWTFRDIVLVAGIISKLEIQITNPIQQICNKYRMRHMWKIRIWNKCNFLGVFQVHINMYEFFTRVTNTKCEK